MVTLAIVLGLIAVGLYVWGITRLVGEKKKAGLILAGATAVLLFLFVPTITDIVKDTGTRAAEDTEQVTDTNSDSDSSSSPSVGETETDTVLGDLTLLKEVYPDSPIYLDPMNVQVNAIKVFKVENPEVSFKADIERYKGEALGNTLYYMTVNFTAENTSSMNLGWLGLASVTLDDGTWLNQSDDDMLLGEDADGNPITPLYPGVTTKEYTQMYVLDDPNIDSVDLEFDQVFGASSGSTVTPSTTETYYFD